MRENRLTKEYFIFCRCLGARNSPYKLYNMLLICQLWLWWIVKSCCHNYWPSEKENVLGPTIFSFFPLFFCFDDVTGVSVSKKITHLLPRSVYLRVRTTEQDINFLFGAIWFTWPDVHACMHDKADIHDIIIYVAASKLSL